MLIKSPQCPLSLYSCGHFCSGGYSTAFGIVEAQIFYVDSVKMYLRMLLRYGMRNHNKNRTCTNLFLLADFNNDDIINMSDVYALLDYLAA
jgi:hypothetical protein